MHPPTVDALSINTSPKSPNPFCVYLYSYIYICATVTCCICRAVLDSVKTDNLPFCSFSTYVRTVYIHQNRVMHAVTYASAAIIIIITRIIS
jgi:hypothetical protein